jgi:heme exporter protein C
LGSSRTDNSLALITGAGLIATMYGAFLWAPTERTMGDIQRIFYIHVPTAWVALMAFVIVFVGSLAFLITKNLLWDRLALASAEIGTIFCTAFLATGPLWAKPVWGIWWTWDARLTSSLILWLMYLGYLLLRDFLEDTQRRATLSAVFGIFAFVDVPIVYFSIRLWRTQHPQPVIMGGEGSGLDPAMFQVFMLALATFTLLFTALLVLRMRLEKSRNEVQQLRRAVMLES